jgi:hypothetical protein
LISCYNLRVSLIVLYPSFFSKTYFNLSLTIFPLKPGMFIEIFILNMYFYLVSICLVFILNMFKLLSNWLFDFSKLVSFVYNPDKYNFKNPNQHLTIYKNLRRSYIFFCKITLEIIICIFYHMKYTKIAIIAKNCIVKLNKKTVISLIRIHIWSDLIYWVSIKSCNIN